MYTPRFLEGEAYIHGGVVYIAKGYQHPPGFIVAYPRYNLLTKTRLAEHERGKYGLKYYWDCIKRKVPIIPQSAHVYNPRYFESSAVLQLKSTLESILGVELHITGSSLVTEEFNDVDFVIYGASEDIVDKLSELFNRELLKRSEYILTREYLSKHSGLPSIQDYLFLKKNTILHGLLQGIHINLKLVYYKSGFNKCVDPVIECREFNGVVEVEKPIRPHIIPSIYSVRINGEELLMESLRELYSELPLGRYIVYNARLEYRESGVYLVPDSGSLIPYTTQ